MDKKRLFLSWLALTTAFALILGRLLWIQLISPRSFSSHKVDLAQNSVFQRQKGIVLNTGRGDFYDRNGTPLTGESRQVLIVFPVNEDFRGNIQQIHALADILNTDRHSMDVFLNGIKQPAIWKATDTGGPIALSPQQAALINKLALPQLKVAEYKTRIRHDSTARHLLGFTNQDPERMAGQFSRFIQQGRLTVNSEIGGAGLERTFQPWLMGIGETSMSYFTDAQEKPLPGLDARMIAPESGYYPLRIMTTLDLPVQQKIESAMDRLHIKEGAVVVLNADSADVAAMASRPGYDPTHIDLKSGEWGNRAVKAAAPGSVYKTLIAAAALEKGVVAPHETFDCEGALGKYGFTCWKKEGHGIIDFEQAFAESCNITFAKVMERLTSDDVELYARKLGLVGPVGWTGSVGPYKHFAQLDNEEGGQLFSEGTARNDDGVRVQTAIGQRDVQITPLQAANLIVTLLHKGTVLSPRVVSEIQFTDGRTQADFPAKALFAGKRAISAKTAEELMNMMELVVKKGTGKELLHAKWELAGKSGTAEITDKANPATHQWFVGYGPAKAPKYAVAVLVKNVPPGQSGQSTALFKEVMDILEQSGKQLTLS